jgi:hypothetical protein
MRYKISIKIGANPLHMKRILILLKSKLPFPPQEEIHVMAIYNIH